MTRSLYDILGVSKNANAEHIKQAYRRLSKSAHPDAGGSAEDFK
jgi:curved DNA-binding protein